MKNSYSRNTLFIIFFALLFIPLISFNNPAKDWIRVPIDAVVSVQFPDEPTPQTINGIQVYTLRTPEAAFMAMVYNQPLNPGQNPITDAHEFYLGLVSSMVRNAKAILTDSAAFTINNHKEIKFSYTSTQADGSKITRQNHSVLINDKLYTLLYTPLLQPTESAQASAKQFLESMEVTE